MTSAAPTLSQIKAQVATIRQRSHNARVIGIQSLGRWTGERSCPDGQNTYLILQCDSPLAIRIALREPVDDRTIKVLLTALEETELDVDILLRLAKQRLFKINSWQIAQSLFQATTIDPRLIRYSWLADYLINWSPQTSYPLVSGGFLDAETAWSILLEQVIGLTGGDRPDVLTLLKWSIDPDHIQRYQSAPDNFREAMQDWLTTSAGDAAATILHCVLHNPLPDALAIGLVLDVVFHPEVEGRLDRAIGKLEATYLSGTAPSHSIQRKWSLDAIEVLRLRILDPQQKSQLIQRADAILTEIGAESFAYLSKISLIGFDQRLARFGESLQTTLAQRDSTALTHLTATYVAIKDHIQAPQQQDRIHRLTMALRLARWLVQIKKTQPSPPRSLEQAISTYLQTGSFVDWARLTLTPGDPIRPLSAALATLFAQVTQIQEQHAKSFAHLLQNWTDVGSTNPAITPIETVLETIVAPLVDHAPVLVIVMDGMTVAICRELINSITSGYDWTLIAPQGQSSSLLAGLSAIPSVTEVSRASLFCGYLQPGKMANEAKGFATHPALYPRCRSGSPPVLFHKPALRENDTIVLADDVRRAIASPQARVVGVVVNAIDDNLTKGDQLDLTWTLDRVRILSTLLYEAKESQRFVIMLSDHGHVIEHNTTYQMAEGEGGERWRTPLAPLEQPTDQELVMTGQRVVIPPAKTLIAPWTEQLRYTTQKHHGYHGGLNPQEMIIPIALLNSTAPLPPNWDESPADMPPWWEEGLDLHSSPQPYSSAPNPDQPDLGPLFSMALEPQISPWISALLASPIYQAQKQRAGKSALSDEDITQLLIEIDRWGNQTTLAILASSLSMSINALSDRLSKCQRLLNIDGYLVMDFNKLANTLCLNQVLLHRHFDL